MSSNRPEWIIHLGCRESLLAHDQGYLQRKRSWKLKLASVHPDRLNQKVKPPSATTPHWDTIECKCGRRMARGAAKCWKCYWPRSSQFRRARESYRIFLNKEHLWYEERHIDPPDYKGHRIPQVKGEVLCLTGSVGSSVSMSM